MLVVFIIFIKFARYNIICYNFARKLNTMKYIEIDEIFCNEAQRRIREALDSGADEYTLRIHSNGGCVDEALAAYDMIRTSGKTFYAHVEGNCHSAAILLLLAAPMENRTATPNSTALIHDIYTFAEGNPDDMRKQADEGERLRGIIADIYSERTGISRDEALQYIAEEVVRDAEWLLSHGFIGAITRYTNFYSKKYANMKKGLFKKMLNLLGESVEVKDENGNVLFTTEREDYQVGDEAEPDGEYDHNGKHVVIKEGIIVAIDEPQPELTDEEKSAKIEELTAEVERLQGENDDLKETLREAMGELREYRAKTETNFKPEQQPTNAKGDPKGISLEDLRADRAKYKEIK